jgi:oxygen-independent coproporphyrinogen-3 oxidase
MESQIEISLEANPGSIDMSYLQELRSFGVNRLSIGMQTPNQEELAILERQHTYDDVINAVEWARTAGINNLNLDLIYGLPNQGCEAWMANLETALSLKPDHLSLYALTIEPGTPMYHKVKAEIFLELDQDITADMYEAASDRLAESGYFQYEISNWARKNKNGELYICRHNMQYWHNLAYIGLGAGAHGYINHQRTINIYSPREYIRRLNFVSTPSRAVDSFPRTPATNQINLIDMDTEIGETMMMGLRLLIEGVSNEMFQRRFGISLQKKFSAQIDRMIKLGLLEWSGTDQKLLRLSKRGRILGNQVFIEFI